MAGLSISFIIVTSLGLLRGARNDEDLSSDSFIIVTSLGLLRGARNDEDLSSDVH